MIHRKPPARAQINWLHPLAVGMRQGWLFNEGNGTTVKSLTGRLPLQMNGTLSWVEGRGMRQPGTDSNYLVTSASESGILVSSATFVGVATVMTPGPQLYDGFIEHGSSGRSGVLIGNVGNPLSYIWSDSSYAYLAGIYPFAVGARLVFGASITKTKVIIHANGQSAIRTDETRGALTFSSPYYIGTDAAINTRCPPMIWEAVYIYLNRDLSIEEWCQLSTDPYAMLMRPQSVGRWATSPPPPPPSAAGGLFWWNTYGAASRV